MQKKKQKKNMKTYTIQIRRILFFLILIFSLDQYSFIFTFSLK